MPAPLFTQNVIALVWDFDRTLIRGHMQEPLFRKYGVDGAAFFREANRLAEFYRSQHVLASDVQYLNNILAYVRSGQFRGLSNEVLRSLGKELTFFPGTLEFFERIAKRVKQEPKYAQHDIRVEHYIVSTGLRQIILGSAIAPHVEYVWACEFAERAPLPGFDGKKLSEIVSEEILTISFVIDDTSKTRAVFEINKGTNKEPKLSVNDSIPHSERRVPFQNIVYIADGPSDVPVFSLVDDKGGKTFAVFEAGRRDLFDEVDSLLQQHRVQGHAPADYSEGSAADMWLSRAVEQIADRMVAEHEERVAKVGRPPRHVIEPPAKPAQEETSPYGIPRVALKDMAEDLLHRAGVTSAPVNLDPILRDLNIRVTERAAQKEDALLFPMSRPGEGPPASWEIRLNSRKAGVRQRFTVAHEVGHVVLHGALDRSSDGAASARDDATKSAVREREAQSFASQLLMPEFLVVPAVQENGANPSLLARLFQVSKAAMEIRLRELRITAQLTDL